MKVLIVHQNAYAPFHSAGTRHFEFARDLISNGNQVCIVASSFFHKTRKETRLADGECSRHEVIDGVPYLWLRAPSYNSNGPRRLWSMLVFAFRVFGQLSFYRNFSPDIVLGSSPPIFTAFAAKLVAKKLKKPFVLEIRDLWPETLVEIGGLSRYHPLVVLMSIIETYLYKTSNLIISTLRNGSSFIEKKCGERKNVIWITNGTRLNFIPEPQKNSEKFFIAMYAGAHGRANDLDTIIDAAKQLDRSDNKQGIQIHLVGDGPQKQRLVQRTISENISNVTFFDSVPKDQVFSTMMKADCFLMTLKKTPLFEWGISPNKLSDYMACARPVVFAVSSSSNPIEESGGGIAIAPGDSKALAEAISEIAAKSLHERCQMGLLGRKYIEEYHDIKKLSQKFEESLLGVIKDREHIGT